METEGVDVTVASPAPPPSAPPAAPAAVAMLRAPAPGMMERSMSEDIRGEREELKAAAEQTLNAIVDLNLDCTVKWVSPSWADVVGTQAESIIGSHISDLIASENKTVFKDVLESMQRDDSRSHRVRFAVVLGPLSKLLPLEELRPDPADNQPHLMDLEGQGIMVYDSVSGGESHTMWMLRPWIAPREIKIDLPTVIVDSLGSGAEVLASYLTQLAEIGLDDPENPPTPPAVLCRICERDISPWWFEKHTDLCLQEHRAELDVQMAQESLTEHRHAIVRVLDILEARQSRHTGSPDQAAAATAAAAAAAITTATAAAIMPVAEYKGMPIGPPPSTRSSPGSSSASSRDRSGGGGGGYGHNRNRSFAVRRPQARIVELLVDLCDTAIEISTPALKESAANVAAEIRSHSPQSDCRISQVLQWQSPGTNTLDQEQGLALLCADTERVAKAKVEAVFRHRKIIEYAERIRVEFSVLVQDCINEAIRKAARIAAGRLSDSTDYDEDDLEAQESEEGEAEDDYAQVVYAAPDTELKGGGEEEEREEGEGGEGKVVVEVDGEEGGGGGAGGGEDVVTQPREEGEKKEDDDAGPILGQEKDYGVETGDESEPASRPSAWEGSRPDHRVESAEGTSALVAALRDVSLRSGTNSQSLSRSRPVSMIEGSRTGSGSPRECRTPRSHANNTATGHVPGATRGDSKRESMLLESDAGDSDSSFRSSSVAPRHPPRTDSPVSEFGDLRRAANVRQHHRKSLILPGTASPRRQESPSRLTQPSSPLRIHHNKPRSFPFSHEGLVSPEASPMLPSSELSSPAALSLQNHHHSHHHHHHRRQSSAAMSEFVVKAAPPSPHLGLYSHHNTSSSNHNGAGGQHGVPGQPRPAQPSIKDFEIIKPISKGAFGSVYLSKKKSTAEYFAIKVLKKADMVAKNQVGNVKAERAIMMWQGESEFVAKLYWTFSSKDYLYLVMEYLNGGDCASLIKVLGGLPEDWVKKYLAEVVLGVEHLHSRGIIHRDLKPDNLLIDQRGHLKLTDFGLSRMGLVGRQKRALSSENADPTPDLLKQGPFARPASMASSRSTSMDLHGPSSGQQTLGGGGGGSSYGLGPSPGTTPQITPDLGPTLGQPSYFNLGSGSHGDRRLSGHRSDSGGSEGLTRMLNSLNTFSLSEPEPVVPSQLLQASPQQQQQQPRSPVDEGQGRPAATALPHYDSISPIPPEAAHYGQQQQQLRQSSSELQGRNTPPHTAAPMMPPPMALFDPEDTNRRFVGTPDYLAPETIKGEKQDETSDWWSVGCIMYEFLYGVPPFNDETAELVFENILARRIQWPDDQHGDAAKGDANNHDDVGDDDGGEPVSDEAKDLINKLLCMEPRDRLGSNRDDKFPSGGDEIRSHSWFGAINWETLLQDEAQFVPQPENPEDTEYFDSRGAVLQSFAEEVEDHATPPTSAAGSEYPDRPHDALSRVRSQFNAVKRNLMPLHIPPHIRDHKSRRLSEPVVTDDFGSFSFKNLPVLEKANKDVIQKLRAEALALQNKGGSGGSSSAPNSTSSSSGGGGPGFSGTGTGSSSNNSALSPGSHTQLSREGSPVMTATTVGSCGSSMIPATQHLSHPVQRTTCAKPANRRQSPSGLGHTNSSPNRISQPSSPLLVSFVAGPGSEGRRKASSNSSSLSQYDIPRVPPSLQKAATTVAATAAATPSVSPVKGGGRQQQQQHASTLPPPSGPQPPPPPPLSLTLSPNRTAVAVGASLGSVGTPRQTSGSTSGRSRSLTVGSQSQDGSPVACDILAGHRNRRSQVFDLSPSSSDNEGGSETKNALLRVQRRRQNSRRLSQVVSLDAGPVFRPLDVLICEDHPVSRMVMEKLLEKLRCRTISVANGSEAVRYSMSDIKFDVIFLEYKLPQISGADVARMIRETKNTNSHTPIVAITAYLKELQAPHYFDSLIEKPISGAKLGEVLKTLCHWRPEMPSRGPSLSLLSSSLPLPRRLSQQQQQHSQSSHPHHSHHPHHGQPHRQISTNLRQSSSRVSDSGPNSALSSPAYTHYAGRPGSSPLASAREGSLSSSLFGDPEFVSTEDIPVLVKGGAPDDRGSGDHGGLGVKEDETAQPDDVAPTLHTILDPFSQSIAGSAQPGGRGRIHPPPARFADRLKPRREARDNREGTDSADDEDEEYSARVASGPSSAPAIVQAGEKMFRAKGAFPSSKLAIEMMRADSHDSFTSDAQTALEVALPVITSQPNKDAGTTATTTPDPSSGPCDPT